jgi:hypothetical protein
MPRKPQAALLKHSEALLRAVRRREAEIGGAAPLRDALERAYTQTLFNRQRQKVARAAAVEATRQLRRSRENLHDAVAALHHYLKAVLGFRSDRLRAFDIEPIRQRSAPRKKPVPGFEPPS